MISEEKIVINKFSFYIDFWFVSVCESFIEIYITRKKIFSFYTDDSQISEVNSKRIDLNGSYIIENNTPLLATQLTKGIEFVYFELFKYKLYINGLMFATVLVPRNGTK